MKKLLLTSIIGLGLVAYTNNIANISYAEDDIFDSFISDFTDNSNTQGSTTSNNNFKNEITGLQKALGTVLNLFYFNFYNEFLNGFFGSIPKLGQDFLEKNGELLGWLAISMSIVTLLIYLFADSKGGDEGESGGDRDLKTVIVKLIESIRSGEQTGNEKTIQIILFVVIIISILILTLLISFLFSKLISKGGIVMMFYNLFVGIAGFSLIFLVVKGIYINGIVDTYLSKESTREDTLKKGVIYLGFIVIGIVLMYSVLDWLKNTLSGGG